MKSNIWLKRQLKDPYVKKAQINGFLSRAAYKLIEIEKKYQILSKSSNILELGSSPGSWSQIICKNNKNAKIDAFDTIDMKYQNKNINFYKEDFLSYDFTKFNNKYDLILSDLAPNSTGHNQTDHLKIIHYIESILIFLDVVLKKNGNFVFKIFKGAEDKKIFNQLKLIFNNVEYFKPKSSRKNSAEIYIIAINLK